MKTFIINEPLHAIGTVKSHMVRKMLYASGTLMLTFACGRTIEYTNVLGVNAEYRMLYVRRYGKEVRIFPATRCDAKNRCAMCVWPAELGFQAIGPTRVEVTCEADSKMEHFVRLLHHTQLITRTA